MECKCILLPDAIYLENQLNNNLNLLDSDFFLWKNLFQCKYCNQNWVIDEWEKNKTQFAIKIDDTLYWKEINYSYFEKQLLLQSRGGIVKESCIWHNCAKYKVKGTAYCIDHLYASGIRK